MALGCGTTDPPRQSTPLLKSTSTGGGRVDMAIDIEGPKPIPRDKLTVLWPPFSELSELQLRAISSVVNVTPSPCIGCGALPIAHCIDRKTVGLCPAMDKLLKRAIRMVKAGHDPGQIKAALNYPDSWVSGLGEGTPVKLHLYRDADGPFRAETAATIKALTAQFGVEVALTIREADVVPDPSLGVRSRPTWFINGHRFRGAQTSGTLARYIALDLLDETP